MATGVLMGVVVLDEVSHLLHEAVHFATAAATHLLLFELFELQTFPIVPPPLSHEADPPYL